MRQRLATALLWACGVPAAAQVCSPLVPLAPGAGDLLPGGATSLAVFDADGPGPDPPRLYALGGFTCAGGTAAPGLAVWSGSTWDAVPGTPPALGRCMAVYDDGRGPALFVAGAAGQLFRFDGMSWASLELPRYQGEIGSALSAAVLDPDGQGLTPASLHLAIRYGSFPSLRLLVFRYDGGSWHRLGDSLSYAQDGFPVVLCGFDPDGPGPAPSDLYAATTEIVGNGSLQWLVSSVARYTDAGGWTQIAGAGGLGLFEQFNAMTVLDPEPPGPMPPRLIIAGVFQSIHLGSTNLPAQNIAAWDGQHWSSLGPGLPFGVSALAPFDADGSGPSPALLIAAGSPSSPARGLAAWDGASWTDFAGGADPAQNPSFTTMLQIDEDGPGPQRPSLAVSGALDRLGGQTVTNFALWRGDAWAGGQDRPVGFIDSLAIFNDGTGRRLFAAGAITAVGAAPAAGLGRWDGQRWTTVPSGVGAATFEPRIRATAVHNDGSGWALYVAGHFQSAGGMPASNVARWNGHAWSAVGQGLDGGEVFALEVHDPDGAGPLPPTLCAAGTFTTADGAPAAQLAAWNGVSWSALAGGVNGPALALRSWDDGTGPALYVGGRSLAPAQLAPNQVAKLSASGWSAVPLLSGDPFAEVTAFAVHAEDVAPLRLYALGLSTTLSRLDGSSWTQIAMPARSYGTAARSVVAGNGRTLLVGTNDGGVWSYAHGVWSQPSAPGRVDAITPAFDDGNGPSVFLAAYLQPSTSPYDRLWRIPLCPACYANCDDSTAPPLLNVNDFLCFQTRFAAGDPYANCDQSTTPPVLNVNDFLCFQQRFAAGCP